MSELVNRHGKEAGDLIAELPLDRPPLLLVKMSIATTPGAREEGVGQHGAGPVKRVACQNSKETINFPLACFTSF